MISETSRGAERLRDDFASTSTEWPTEFTAETMTGFFAEESRCKRMPARECAERCDCFCIATDLTDGEVDELVARHAKPGAAPA